jgi:hypothetical protein
MKKRELKKHNGMSIGSFEQKEESHEKFLLLVELHNLLNLICWSDFFDDSYIINEKHKKEQAKVLKKIKSAQEILERLIPTETARETTKMLTETITKNTANEKEKRKNARATELILNIKAKRMLTRRTKLDLIVKK